MNLASGEECADRLERIIQWCDAYPVSVFTEVSSDELKRAHAVLADAGISGDAMHATWARQLLHGISDIAKGESHV